MAAQNTRSTESNDRIAALTAPRTAAPASTAKTTAGRFSQTANRILNALMRTLATPHI